MQSNELHSFILRLNQFNIHSNKMYIPVKLRRKLSGILFGVDFLAMLPPANLLVEGGDELLEIV